MYFTTFEKFLKCARISGIFVAIIVAIKIYFAMKCDLNAVHGEVSSMSIKCKQLLYASLELHPFNMIDCSRIIKGDEDAIYEASINGLLITNKHVPITEDQYMNLTTDCTKFKKIRKFLTFSTSQEEEDFPIAYSMVIHNQIEMFERLLRAIYTPHNIYCVHVDEKSPEKFKEVVKAITSCFDNVFVASKLERVVYASWWRVQADLNCMEELLRSKVQWKYLLNTCGTDFPTKTNAEIVKALKHLNGKNSMESEQVPHKRGRWLYHYEVDRGITKTEQKKEPPPDNITMFSGNAYNVMARGLVEVLFTDPKVKRLIEWVKDTYSPDEHLWATLNRMQGVPGSLPMNRKYDTSDLQSIARLVKWDGPGDMQKGAAYEKCHGVYRRSVCVYGMGDLSWMVQQPHLLANKFDPFVDNDAIQCLEQYTRHKALYGTDL